MNASGSDLNKLVPSSILRNNSKIIRNSKLAAQAAVQVQSQYNRGFNQISSARGLDSSQDGPLGDEAGFKDQNGQNIQKQNKFQGYFAPKTQRVQ